MVTAAPKTTPACPLCGARAARPFLNALGLCYVECPSCTLVFLDLSAGEDNIYTQDYIEKRGHNLLASHIVKAKEATAHHYFSLAEQYIPKGNLLEVGCSTGLMLKVAKERGWKVYGLEINSSAAAIAAQTAGVDTITDRELSEDSFPGVSFSLVALFDVIEHIADPMKFMGALKKKLAPEGQVLFVTPDIHSFSAKVLKGKWPHLFPDHTRLYSPKSMDILLEKSGLKIVKSGWAPKFVTAEMLHRHLECHPHILFSRQARAFLSMPWLADRVFPFNVGELYVLARNA